MMSDSNQLIQALSNLMKLGAFKDLKIFVEGEVALLFLVYQSEEKMMSPKDIAANLGISKGRVTALINSLSEKELIDIAISLEDRRSFNIMLTPLGLDYLKPKIQKAEAYFSVVSQLLGKEKTDVLVSIINEITTVMEGVTI